MKKLRGVALVLAGVLIGIAVASPVANAAEEWYKAYRSGGNFYVDGEKIEMEAYLVQDNN